MDSEEEKLFYDGKVWKATETSRRTQAKGGGGGGGVKGGQAEMRGQ